MTEILEVFDLKGKRIGEQERKAFYEESRREYREKGRVSRQLKTIRAIILNSQGRIYLQKRSRQKPENPGLYDKTVGGHVAKQDTWNMTLIRECAEELGFPAAILTEKEFDAAVGTTDLSVVGVCKRLAIVNAFESRRESKEGPFVQPYISAFYLGHYDGPIRFVDGESCGIEVFSIDELKRELRAHPENFTEDIKYMLRRFGRLLKPLR